MNQPVQAVTVGAGFQFRPEADFQIGVEEHQVAVERAIVQRVQAKAVSWVHALFWIIGPRDDVAGDEQFGHGQAGDAAFAVVGGEHGGAEEMLVHAHAHQPLTFAALSGQIAFVNGGEVFEFAPAELRQQSLALEGECGGVVLEVAPDRVDVVGVVLGIVVLDQEARAFDRVVVPVAVRFEHPLAVGVGARSLWLPRVTITSDQPWLDGMIAENLRSAVHRFTFNTWREDEPRYPCYRDGVFNRNIHTALIALDDPRRLWGWVRLWLMALRSCGFMPEAFGLAVPPLRDLAWLDRPLVIGNDGTGFTMIQWGKLFLRADDALRRDMLRHDLADLRLLARAVQRALHWTGQIEDHSEPVEGIRTDRYLAGSPYAQALCLAGALLVRRALALANSPAAEVRQLAELYAGLAKRLREGLDRASAKDGRFMDITSDQNQRHPHTYTNLAPGMILTDPDLGEEAYADRAVLERTLKANVVYHPKGRPYRVLTCPYWPPHPGLSHNAYSQIAAIINCLALEREKEAASYLDDLIRCTRADFTRHMLSDPKYTLHDWQVETRDFARFIIPEGVVPGHDAIKINPGNGVNVSYFLYLVDRMVGITPRAGHIEIAPQPAGQRRWEVADYPTRLGSVSYRLERERGVIRFWCATGAPAQLGLPVGPRASLVVDGRPYRPGRGAAAVTAGRAWLRLSPGTHTVVAHTAGSLPATVGTAVPDQKF